MVLVFAVSILFLTGCMGSSDCLTGCRPADHFRHCARADSASRASLSLRYRTDDHQPDLWKRGAANPSLHVHVTGRRFPCCKWTRASPQRERTIPPQARSPRPAWSDLARKITRERSRSMARPLPSQARTLTSRPVNARTPVWSRGRRQRRRRSTTHLPWRAVPGRFILSLCGNVNATVRGCA